MKRKASEQIERSLTDNSIIESKVPINHPNSLCKLHFYKQQKNRINKKVPITQGSLFVVSMPFNSISSVDNSYKAVLLESHCNFFLHAHNSAKYTRYACTIKNIISTSKPKEYSGITYHTPNYKDVFVRKYLLECNMHCMYAYIPIREQVQQKINLRHVFMWFGIR